MDPFATAVSAALSSTSIPPDDARLLRGRTALGRWDAAGLTALARHFARTGEADGDAAVCALLRDGGKAWRAELARGGSGSDGSGGGSGGGGDGSGGLTDDPAAAARREAWREEARSRAAHREYAQLVAGTAAEAPAETFSSFRQQLSLGSAAFAGLFTAVALGYYLGRILYGENDTRAWTVALFCGIGLLIVEMSLLVIQLYRMDQAVARRKRAGGEVGGNLRREGDAGPALTEERLARKKAE